MGGAEGRRGREARRTGQTVVLKGPGCRVRGGEEDLEGEERKRAMMGSGAGERSGEGADWLGRRSCVEWAEGAGPRPLAAI
eukprot:167606-Rhodomonas_salina.1